MGLGLLIAAVVLWVRFGSKYELKPIDFILVIIPLLFALLIGGKLKMLEAFGVKADFARWLNSPSGASQDSLSRLPGFVSVDQAVTRKQSKRDVLRQMEKIAVDSLPVVDQSGLFFGMVDRSQLTASHILEVSDRLEGKTPDSN